MDRVEQIVNEISNAYCLNMLRKRQAHVVIILL